jgi:transcriptional regulator with XRE-family HTH domain
MSVSVDPEVLRHEMARRGMSARDLARRTRLSPATVSNALAGKPISEDSLRRIATALDATPIDSLIDCLLTQ